MDRKPNRDNDYKRMNSLITNLSNMSVEKNDRYNVNWLYYCVRRLALDNGQSMRYVLCSLLESGLRSCEKYSGQIDGLRKEFDLEYVK